MFDLIQKVHDYAVQCEQSLTQDFHDVMNRLKAHAQAAEARAVLDAIDLLQRKGYTVTEKAE